MANTIREYGKLIIPKADFDQWLLAQLNPPTGSFVAFGDTVFVGDRLETLFNIATDYQPAPPPPPIIT